MPDAAPPPAAAPRMDRESQEWVRVLGAPGPAREAAMERLHALLLRAAQGEVRRRSGRLGIAGPELDDLAHQAAADALMDVAAKLGAFRGESRFTTWAFRFVIFDVSRKLARHFWRAPAQAMGEQEWERLPDRFGLDPERQAEWRDLVAALQGAVEHDLTAHQRRIFVALVLRGTPLDVLAAELGSNRNAIYKTMFEARRTLRRSLTAKGFMDPATLAPG